MVFSAQLVLQEHRDLKDKRESVVLMVLTELLDQL